MKISNGQNNGKDRNDDAQRNKKLSSLAGLPTPTIPSKNTRIQKDAPKPDAKIHQMPESRSKALNIPQRPNAQMNVPKAPREVPRPSESHANKFSGTPTATEKHLKDRAASADKKRGGESKIKEKKHYSILVAAKAAVSGFKKDISDSKKANGGEKAGFLGELKAVGKFIGKSVYIFFRSIWRFLVALAVIALGVCLMGLVAIGYLYATSVGEVPSLKDYSLIAMPQDSTIFDKEGEVIGVISTSARTPVAFNQISQAAKDAIVSIEDERFYNHEGVDFIGIARALKSNYDSWRSGGSSTSQGASTITQQYVRNAYQNVGKEQTVSRKMTEMMLAAELESTMSKDDILNSYLNTVYYGNGCYGIEAASQYYFGHGADTLNYYEAALLASVLNSPTMYNLATEEGRVDTAERANLVLDKMYSLGKLGDITQNELHELKKTDVTSLIHLEEKEQIINQPYYYDYVMSELKKKYTDEEIKSGGWQIYTTLSIADGNAAAEVVKGIEEEYGEGITGAIADIDVATGSINAFCGGTDYAVSQYDIATSAQLQTGSALKPIVYAALCEYDGYYISDPFDCAPIDIAGPGETPHVIKSYIGGSKATIDKGIIASDNAMAIHAGNTVGMDKVAEMVAAVGMTSPLDQNVVATIGGQSTGFTPLEMATAYATVANKGQKRDTWSIKNITDNYGNVVYEHEAKSDYAMSSEVALQITRAMENAVDQAGWYNLPFDQKGGWTIAAKTGTTDEETDIWCSGFDTTRSVSVWIGGRDARTPVTGGSSRSCLAMSDYMYAAASDDPKQTFEQPKYKTEIPTYDSSKTFEQYLKNLEGKRFEVEIKYVSDKNASEGSVLSVANAGQLADRGSSVVLSVARDKVLIPDFTKMSPNDVYANSDGLNVSYEIEYVTSGNSSPTIIKQSISSGTIANKGDSIQLTVQILSQNKDSVIQQTPTRGSDSALTLLEKERNDLKTQNSRLQSYLDDTNAKLQEALNNNKNSTETVLVPDVRGLKATDAKQVLVSCGFKVSFTGSDDAIVGSTTPTAGTQHLKGGTITLKTQTTDKEDDPIVPPSRN